MTTELKEWLSAREIAALDNRGLPCSARAVHHIFLRNGVTSNPALCRKRKGTAGVEFHKSVVPPEVDRVDQWLTGQEIIEMGLIGVPDALSTLQAQLKAGGVEDDPNRFRKYGRGRAHLYHRSVVEDLDSSNWFSCSEIAQMDLPGFPKDASSIARYFRGKGILYNSKLSKRGKRCGHVFHINALPDVARERAKRIVRAKGGLVPKSFHLLRKPVAQLAEIFPTASRISIDPSRPKSKWLIVRVPALSRPAT